jgi:hypothetical protein
MRIATAMLLGVGLVGAVGTAAGAAPSERRLHLATAEASSFLVNDWNKFQENYLPLYVGDDDPRTAWTEGVKGTGTSEWLRVRVTPMAGATRVRLRVRNGYQKTARLFAANARARAVKVVLLPSGKVVDAELADRQDWQEVLVEQPAGPLEAVELRFVSVYPGTKYDDLCISDVQLLVTAATPDNPAFEKGRQERILKWKAERLAAAKLFKTAAAKSLPVGPQYRVQVDDTPVEKPGKDRCKGDWLCMMGEVLERTVKDSSASQTHAAALGRAQALVKRRMSDLVPVQAVARDKRKLPAVDGLCTPGINSCLDDGCYVAFSLPGSGQVAFLQTAGLGILNVTDSPALADALAGKPKECRRRDQVKTWAWAMRGKPGADGTAPLEALFLVSCGMVESREGYMEARDTQLLVFGQDGKLELLATPYEASAVRWRAGPTGPIIAGGRQVNFRGETLTLEEAVSVAAK